MPNNNSELNQQQIANHSQATKLLCLTVEQCAKNFTMQLSSEYKPNQNWLDLYPVAAQTISHFYALPQPLLLLNAQFWHAAKVVIEQSNPENNPLLALQNYDQQILFGRINLTDKDNITIEHGEIHNYNNGTLLLHISPLLVSPNLWFLLKAFLLSQHIPASAAINGDKMRGVLNDKLSDQIFTKIILVANRYQLDELAQIDPDYTQVSALFAEIASDIKSTPENIVNLQQFCESLIVKYALTPLNKDAYIRLFSHLSRQCEHQNKLLFSPKTIESILRYAQIFNTQKGNISAEHIQKVIDIQQQAQSNAQDFSDQALVEKQLKIQLQGQTIGQINGLSVVELMGYPTEFGEIFRISASDMIGDGEIIDVERKVELAGNVHAKATLIVQGYLNHFFTHIANFPLSCNVVFEQSYQESDGDSASLAILLAVTSCYAGQPIKQNLFVTGALDQHGNVLAIGGINQKINAITRLFSLGLLNDPVTVLIPQANQINLTLDAVTLALIATKKLNIYGIDHCHQAFPFVMSCSFEEVIEIINKRVMQLHKEENEDDDDGLLTKCLNWLR